MNDWDQEIEKYLNKSFERLKPGNIVSGKIIKIYNDYAFVDIGLKEEALLPIEELKNSNGDLILGEGEDIEGVIVGKNYEENLYILSFKKLREKNLWEELKEAYQNKKPIKVKVLSFDKAGYKVEFASLLNGFMPLSQSFFQEKPQNFEVLIGKIVEVEILEIKKDNFIVSRKEFLAKQYQRKKELLMEKIKAGEILEGTVKKKVEGGFLIDLEEVLTGYLPYKELDWKRIENPSEYLKIGDKVKVKVLSYDPVRDRLKLSIKALLPDPWHKVSERYKEGDIIEGRITQIHDFGAFVELEPGIEGLIPAKEIAWNKKVKINEILEVGQKVSVLILKISTSERKMTLSLRALLPDPFEEFTKKYKIGDVLEGIIQKISPGGLLVEITPEITVFMPLKEFLREVKPVKKNLEEIEGFKEGEKIKGKIISIDLEKRKIQISYLKYLEDLESKEIKEFTVTERPVLKTLGEYFSKR